MTQQRRRRSTDPDAEHLEALRLKPTQREWRREIERILNGERDAVIERRGDAGAYVEDLIAQGPDPAASRVAFQDALEHQVATWKPPRGVPQMLELLWRFTPRSGSSRLIEMFKTVKAFPGDPPLGESNFFGRDLRLRALHALERYFPAAYRSGKDGRGEQDADPWEFASYVALLEAHVAYPRYRKYAQETLRSLLEPVFGMVAREAPTKHCGLESIECGDADEAMDLPRGLEPFVQTAEHGAEPLLIAPPMEAVYESFLADGAMPESAFRDRATSLTHLNCKVTYGKTGPRFRFQPERGSVISPFQLNVSRENYPRYYIIYVKDKLRSSKDVLWKIASSAPSDPG